MKYAEQLILGHIIPLDTDTETAEAMAVKDGRIVYIGSERVARRFCNEETKVLDYGADTVYPGFIDAHCHGLMAGKRLRFECALKGPVKDMKEYADQLAEYIAQHPGEPFYAGAGWEPYGVPSAAILDRVCDTVPVVLTSIDGHSVWVNTRALEAAGIDENAVGKYGTSMIRTGADGRPTGHVCEAATALLTRLTAPTVEMAKEGLLAWQEFAFRNGLTGACEAMLDCFPGGVGAQAYQELENEGKWKLHTWAFPTERDPDLASAKPADAVEKLKADAAKYHGKHFRVAGLKLFMDGVVEAHTASLIEPYADQPDDRGVNYYIGRQELLNERVALANAAGFPVHFHAIGDRAVKMAMDAVEYAVLTNCDIRPHNCMAHLQLVRPEDIRRFAEYHVTAIVAPLWVPAVAPYFAGEIAVLGEDRAWSEYPIRSFEDAGATICFHSDYPVSPQMDAPKQVYQAVKRGDPEKGPKSVKNPDEGIGVLRALLAMTVNAAYLFGASDDLGTLSVGKLACCSVYDTDFLRCGDPRDIAKAKGVATVVDGEEVWHA